MKTTTTERRIAHYREELEKELAALPSHEVQDLTEEVESHLREASAEGRLEEYLVEIGQPESFAADILSERGLLPDSDVIPEAPGWRRLIAAIIDLIVALAPFVLAVVIGSSMYVPEDVNRGVAGAVLLGVIAVTLSWTVGYWRSRTRRGGRSSAGMTLMDMRPVRAGGEVRVVRRSSVAGEGLRLRGLVWAVVLLGIASWLVLPILYEVTVAFPRRQAEQNIQSAIRATSWDVGMAMTMVSSLGQALSEGANEAELLTLVNPGALKAAEGLRESARGGEYGGLMPVFAHQASYGSAKENFDESDATIVIEAQEEKDPTRLFRFTIRKLVVIQEVEQGHMSSPDYQIVLIEPAR